MKVRKLGVIGLSEGNGHPFSWSAIFNGYDKNEMGNCGFPAIPNYLERQSFPKDCIKNAIVTHVFAEDFYDSRRIAKCCNIPNIASSIEHLVDNVDAVLLARDDYYNHYKHAKYAIQQGKPIYIDKPIATTLEEHEYIFNSQVYSGQIFTCSALRFSDDVRVSSQELLKLGKIVSIEGYTPKSWEKYAIHVLEPILLILRDNALGNIAEVKKVKKTQDRTTVEYVSTSNIIINITSTGRSDGEIKVIVHGEVGSIERTFNDPFLSFKKALQYFIDSIEQPQFLDPAFTRQIVWMIEKGL